MKDVFDIAVLDLDLNIHLDRMVILDLEMIAETIDFFSRYDTFS